MNGYVYLRSEPSLWTAGYYDPAGKWQPESDHSSEESAAARVHFLNGGVSEKVGALIAATPKMLEALHKIVNNWDNLHPKDRQQARAALAAVGV